jgi:trimeric autotransporter adhesin
MKKNLLRSFFTAACALVGLTAFAQLPMTRSTFTGTYNAISLPAATLSTATGDDVAQSAIPIGFTFDYLGTNYTSIGLNTNGVASFSATMSASGTNNNLFVANAPNLSLAPWWDNLISDTVLYQLQGSPGSQTFTIQWTNSLSYFNSSDQLLNFQVVLYETSNVIEFHYGNFVAGTAAPNESASIGIEGATGGAGDYLDAVTGSAFTSNGMLNAATQWPSHHFRFTPGLPTVIPTGVYTVGLAGTYYNLSEAIADLNHRGISGAVTLSLLDANYDATPANGDNFFPMLLGPVAGTSSTNSLSIVPATGFSTITSEGTLNGNCGNAAANNVITNANEPVFALVGLQNADIHNLHITTTGTGVVDRGLSVLNSSATLGSQFNIIQGITVSLDRANTGCYGISQQAITAPTAATGSNSTNSYWNLTISNVYTGIYLNGNTNFPDQGCSVGTSSPSIFNTIGAATPNDIGAGTGNTATYGIRANNQRNVNIYNNEVRNLSHAGTSIVEGIVLDAAQGNCAVYHNKVHDVNYTGATSTANVSGIRANVSNVGGANIKIYNNFVYAIGSSYTGAASATRAVRGIFVQSIGGGGNTDTTNVDFNNVRIDLTGAPNLSSTCFETGSGNGPILNVRNNVFANFTGAQAGIAMHYVMASSVINQIGDVGSVSNYNDLFLNNTTNGNVGIGQTTGYITLADWQTGMTQDANSISIDPGFNSATDIHVSAVALNTTANPIGISWVTDDIDNQARAITPDIGADEFVPLLLDAGVVALDSPAASGCHSVSETVMVTLKNFAAAPLDFTVDPVTVTVNVTGAITQTLTFAITNNLLNGNTPVPSGASIQVPLGTINMSANGNYTFDAYSTLSGDGNAVNDTMIAVNVNYTVGTATASPTGVCAGSSTTLTLSGFSAGGTIQWMSSTDGGNTWLNEVGVGSNTALYTVIPTGNTLYQVSFCGTLLSNVDTVSYYTLSVPVVADDTVCGPGSVNLTASGTGTINWYADSAATSVLATGNTFTTNVIATDTFYVTNTTGNLVSGVGLFDNSAGGGMSASPNNLIFDVLFNCTLNGVYVYPAAAGNITIDLADNTNTVLNSVTVAVTAADVNQRTFIPLNFNLSPATDMQLQRNASSVNLWRNNVGVNYPYTIPGILSITGSTAGGAFYYFFYDWQIGYGCESPSSPLIVTVLTPPAISISAASTSLCAGDSTSITVTSGNSNYAYTWTPSGTLNTSTGTTVVATPTGTTTYTVNALDTGSGCRTTDSVSITVTMIPPATITATDTLICPGQSDTLVIMAPANSVGLFDNSVGGGMSASVNNLIFDVLSNCTLQGVYVYPATAGNVIIELQDNTNAVLNTVTFVATAADVNQRTFVPLNFVLTPATGMQLVRNVASISLWRNNAGVTYPYTLPGLISITTSTAGNGFYYFFYNWQIVTGTYSYAWTSVPAGFTATGDTAIDVPTVTTQYIITVTDSATGCTTQFTKTINVAGAVNAIISGPASICLGDSTYLVASATGGDATYNFSWSNALGTNDSIMVNPTVNTTYTVTITDGCGSVDTASVTLVVSTVPPTAAFTYNATGVQTYTFTDGSTGATNWAWDFGDANTSSNQNPVHTYATTGTYTVVLIASNGCGADTITQVITVTGIDEAVFMNSVSIYPNPAHGSFQISLTGMDAAFATIELYDLQGKLLLTQQLNNFKSGQVSTVDLTVFARGMYMLNVKTDKGAGTFKLIVE